MKTNVELVEELKQVVIKAMKTTDMFEIELYSHLPVSRMNNVLLKFREWVESPEFAESFLYKDVNNWNLLIYKERAKEYVESHFLNAELNIA